MIPRLDRFSGGSTAMTEVLTPEPPEPPAPDEDVALAAGSLGLTAITFQGITHMAPAAGVMLSAPFIASFAGPAMGLAFGFAGVAALFLANSVSQLAKHLPSAGGYFSYISRALNPKLGFMAGWMYFLYDPIVPILCTVIIGGYTEDTLQQQYGINFPWWAYSIIVWLGLGVITFLGVKPSIATAIILTLVEVGITLALSFTIFAQQGVTSHDLSQGFTLSGIPGNNQVHGLFLAMVFSVLSYTGFESTAPLAEETRNPKRNVAIAAIVGTALILVYYVIFGFATALGFGIDKVASDFPGASNPYYTIANDAWGSAGTIIVLLALINSGWGCSLAGQSAVTRVYYKMANVGVFPPAFGRLHPRYRSPHIAIGLQTIFNICLGLFCGWYFGTVNTFGIGGAMITFGMIFVYGCGLVAVPIFYLREHRDEFNIVTHLIFSILGLACLVPVFYYSIVPFPPYPIKIAPIADIVWFVIGILVVVYLASRRAGALERSREIFEDAQHLEA
jgi:amino acid transporter